MDKVLFFSVVAIISFLANRIFNSKKLLFHFLPSFKVILLLALLPTSLSLLSNYFAFMGWCCEQPFGFYFGFPFSFLLGIAGFDQSLTQYANYGLFEILATSEFTVRWKFLLYKFFLNILFWSNISFISLGLLSLLSEKRKFAQQPKETNTT